MKQSNEKKSTYRKRIHYEKIIGILFIILGIVILFIQIPLNLKISATLVILGFVIFLLGDEEQTHKTINHVQLILIIVILILVVWVVTINAGFDIFLLLIIIVLLLLKEFVHKFLSPYLQKRMSILFYILLILSFIILLQRIINILHMYSG